MKSIQGFIVIKAYVFFYHGKLHKDNWGDDLNYYLLKIISGKQIIFKNQSFLLSRKTLNYACIGSIIEWLRDSNTIVWGSGAIKGGTTPLKIKPKKVLAVRGPLTRDYLQKNGVECPEIYGDPALLLPRFYKPKVHKKKCIGIIPHVCDQQNHFLLDFKDKNPDVIIIDLKNYGCWTDVIDQICQCEFIISSSLHGLIVSDAYGIPNVWVEFSDKIIGNGFKFQDYFASVGKNNILPYKIDKPIELAEMREKILNWKPIQIDLDALWEVCPFKK